MDEKQINNYNEHAIFMAEIAKEVLKGNGNIFNINGIREIIALYLLIPYMTESTLQTPDSRCIIPRINGEFVPGVSFSNLRDTICHSFVTTEEDKGDGIHGKKLIFDDRLIVEKKAHSQKGLHGEAYFVLTEEVHNILNDKIENIINQINV